MEKCGRLGRQMPQKMVDLLHTKETDKNAALEESVKAHVYKQWHFVNSQLSWHLAYSKLLAVFRVLMCLDNGSCS